MTLLLTKDNFEEEVMNSDKPVLIDFFADWCGPCKMQGPVIDEMAEEMDSVKICQIDVEAEKELAQQFKIMSIPTLIIIKNGEITQRVSGFRRKGELLELLAD